MNEKFFIEPTGVGYQSGKWEVHYKIYFIRGTENRDGSGYTYLRNGECVKHYWCSPRKGIYIDKKNFHPLFILAFRNGLTLLYVKALNNDFLNTNLSLKYILENSNYRDQIKDIINRKKWERENGR